MWTYFSLRTEADVCLHGPCIKVCELGEGTSWCLLLEKNILESHHCLLWHL